jgi:hypothetical protein
MKYLLFFLFAPIFLTAQTQIGNSINGEAVNDNLGNSVSLSSDGTIIAVGIYNNDDNGTNCGQVKVYQNVSGVWTQIGSDINGEAAGERRYRLYFDTISQ